jgi:antitoxin MazE
MPARKPKPIEATVNQWGNGLAVRITKAVAEIAGFREGTAVRIVPGPGRVIIETTEREPTLGEMLESFDPARHGGEVMAFKRAGREVL